MTCIVISEAEKDLKTGQNTSINFQKFTENSTLTSEKLLPFSTPTVKIETERPKKDLHYGRPSQEMAKIDPVIEPRTQLECGIIDEKFKISYVENDYDEKSARLDPSSGQNSLIVLSQNPRGLGSTLQVRPECFSDIIAKQKQTSLVILPNLGKVVLQSESSTSEGKKKEESEEKGGSFS